MKKSFTANISGSIFYIDEDAYILLQSYFDQLHAAFKGEDGAEIVNDIEARIAELLNDRPTGSAIVTLADVNKLIAQVGSPEELNGTPIENHDNSASETSVPPPFETVRSEKRLYRDESNRVLGGVLSGIGEYYGWNITLLRVLAVILTFTTWFFPCFLAYIVAWCVIPAAHTPIQKLEMNGTPINPITLGQQILTKNNVDSTANQIGRIIGIGFLALTGMICGGMFVSMLSLLIWSIGALIGISVFAIPWDRTAEMVFFHSADAPLLTLFVSLASLIILGVILWGIGIVLFKFPRISRSVLIVCAVATFLLLIASVIAGNAVAAQTAMY